MQKHIYNHERLETEAGESPTRPGTASLQYRAQGRIGGRRITCKPKDRQPAAVHSAGQKQEETPCFDTVECEN